MLRPQAPRTFLTFKPALLAMPDADRAYLRAWVLKYVDENGAVVSPEQSARRVPAPKTGSYE